MYVCMYECMYVCMYVFLFLSRNSTNQSTKTQYSKTVKPEKNESSEKRYTLI